MHKRSHSYRLLAAAAIAAVCVLGSAHAQPAPPAAQQAETAPGAEGEMRAMWVLRTSLTSPDPRT